MFVGVPERWTPRPIHACGAAMTHSGEPAVAFEPKPLPMFNLCDVLFEYKFDKLVLVLF